MAPDSDTIVCFCYSITRGEIREAIRNGAKTIEEIRAQTLANTGCGGCEWEVQELLEQELALMNKTGS